MSSTVITAPLLYVECDIAEGQTLVDWRRERTAASGRRHARRALRVGRRRRRG